MKSEIPPPIRAAIAAARLALKNAKTKRPEPPTQSGSTQPPKETR